MVVVVDGTAVVVDGCRLSKVSGNSDWSDFSASRRSRSASWLSLLLVAVDLVLHDDDSFGSQVKYAILSKATLCTC